MTSCLHGADVTALQAKFKLPDARITSDTEDRCEGGGRARSVCGGRERVRL